MSKHRHRGKRAQRPPDGVAWVWHTVELLDSVAWRGRSIHCRRLIDFLEREHLHHGGNENGNLLATYSQLQAEGISRKSIHGAIQEAEQRGLVAVERGGRKGAVLNELNRFRLTYLWHRTRKDGVWNWHEPTDNWRTFEAPTRAIGAQMGTATVPKWEPPRCPNGNYLRCPNGNREPRKLLKSHKPPRCPSGNPLLYLGRVPARQCHPLQRLASSS